MSHQQKCIVIGSVTEDTLLVPDLKTEQNTEGKEIFCVLLGEKIAAKELILTGGGGGANVAYGLRRGIGADVHVFGAIGSDDAGRRQVERMKKEGIETQHILWSEQNNTSASVILVAESGERVVFHHAGAGGEFCQILPRSLYGADAICLMHLHEKNGDICRAIEQYTEENPETFFTWNPGKPSLRKGPSTFGSLLQRLSLLMVNETEICLFTGAKEPTEGLKNLYQQGHLRKGQLTAMTHGKEGSIVTDGEMAWHFPALTHWQRQDTLGAGDSFLSGMVMALLSGEGVQSAQISGSINAASVVSQHGAQEGLLSWSEIQKLCDELKTQNLSQTFSLFS